VALGWLLAEQVQGPAMPGVDRVAGHGFGQPADPVAGATAAEARGVRQQREGSGRRLFAVAVDHLFGAEWVGEGAEQGVVVGEHEGALLGARLRFAVQVRVKLLLN
jgi:hypothetical protein